MTMRSENGALIGMVLVGAGFAAAVDSQLFQKAVSEILKDFRITKLTPVFP